MPRPVLCSPIMFRAAATTRRRPPHRYTHTTPPLLMVRLQHAQKPDGLWRDRHADPCAGVLRQHLCNRLHQGAGRASARSKGLWGGPLQKKRQKLTRAGCMRGRPCCCLPGGSKLPGRPLHAPPHRAGPVMRGHPHHRQVRGRGWVQSARSTQSASGGISSSVQAAELPDYVTVRAEVPCACCTACLLPNQVSPAGI